MTFLKLLFTSILSLSIFDRSFGLTSPHFTSFKPLDLSPPVSDLPIFPDFALQLIESNLELVQLTFNNPENSFNVITDPQQRLQFLQGISTSINDISSSLSLIIQQINPEVDTSFISILDSQIVKLNKLIISRVQDYLLPIDVSQIEINPDFIIYRFNQSEISTIYNEVENFFITIPEYLQPLNQSLFDLSLQIQRYSDIHSKDGLIFKLSDIQGLSFPNKIEFIISINQQICDFVSNCNLYCQIYNPLSGLIEIFPSQIYDLHQVRCEVPVNQPQIEENLKSSISTSEFYSLTVFKGDYNQNKSSLSPVLISFITLICVGFAGILIYVYLKYLKDKRKKNHIFGENNLRYQSV
jgi:hypothetical protein